MRERLCACVYVCVCAGENEGSNGIKKSEERKAEEEEETVQWVRLFWQVGGCGGGDMG